MWNFGQTEMKGRSASVGLCGACYNLVCVPVKNASIPELLLGRAANTGMNSWMSPRQALLL